MLQNLRQVSQSADAELKFSQTQILILIQIEKNYFEDLNKIIWMAKLVNN